MQDDVKREPYCGTASTMFKYSIKVNHNYFIYKYENLLKSQSRRKRELFILASLGVTALAALTKENAVFFAGKNANDVKDQVRLLEKQMMKTDKKVDMLKEAMIGLA